MNATSMRAALVLLSLGIAFAARANEDERSSAPLLVRTETKCKDAGPTPPFSVTTVPGGARFTLALAVDNTCTTVAVGKQVLDDDVRITLTPQFSGQVVGACEVVCSGELVVTGWVRRTGLQTLTVTTPTKALRAERKGAAWLTQTATVHFTSTPSDAAVFRSPQVFLGRTPLTVTDEPSGPATYFLVKEQASTQVDLDLTPGENRRVRTALREGDGRPRDCDPILDFDCRPVRDAPVDSLSKSEILSVVKAAMPAIDRCAELHPTEVILKTTWSVSADGRVKDAKIVDPRWADDPMGLCVLKVLRAMRFPRHATPPPPITFPFRMR